MSPIEFSNELKGWQTGIGALLGFLALIVGALWNFHLNRRRDAALRAEEALSVAAALYGEILLLRKEVGRLARAVANVHVNGGTTRNPIVKFDEHFLEAHSLSEPLLYKALAPKIGLLSSDLILYITEFHQKFQEARMSLPLLVDKPGRKYGYSVATVLVPARDAVKNIQPALKKIERMASVSRPADDVDLGQTEDVIEMEEEFLNTPSPP